MGNIILSDKNADHDLQELQKSIEQDKCRRLELEKKCMDWENNYKQLEVRCDHWEKECKEWKRQSNNLNDEQLEEDIFSDLHIEWMDDIIERQYIHNVLGFIRRWVQLDMTSSLNEEKDIA